MRALISVLCERLNKTFFPQLQLKKNKIFTKSSEKEQTQFKLAKMHQNYIELQIIGQHLGGSVKEEGKQTSLSRSKPPATLI